MLPSEVLLSHSSDDREFADSIVEVLRNHGIPVWYSQTNIVGAQQWHDKIGAALQRCDWFALVLSKSAVESMWVKRELLYVLQQNRFDNTIIPIRYKPCDINQRSWTLSCLQTINFVDNFHPGCTELLRIGGLGYRQQR